MCFYWPHGTFSKADTCRVRKDCRDAERRRGRIALTSALPPVLTDRSILGKGSAKTMEFFIDFEDVFEER